LAISLSILPLLKPFFQVAAALAHLPAEAVAAAREALADSAAVLHVRRTKILVWV
jgi:hypothetical protein